MSYFHVKVFAIHCLVQFNSVYFLFNFSVIFTWLILSLFSLKSCQCSLKRGLCKLRVFKTFLLISSVNTWLNITNCWLICTVYLGLLTLVCFYVKGGGGAGVTHLSMRIHSKNCCIFPLTVASTLHSGSRKGTVGALVDTQLRPVSGLHMLILQALTYIEGHDLTGRPIWNFATGTLTSWKGC